MRRSGKSYSKQSRGSRKGQAKKENKPNKPSNNGRSHSAQKPYSSEHQDGSQFGPTRGSGPINQVRRQHGKPNFRSTKPFNRANDQDDRRLLDVQQHAIEKSKTSIKNWLEAGAELRSKRELAVQEKVDPKLLSLDPWQQQVLDLLRSGESVVVDAPTTAGKTRAVEVFFAQNIDDPTFRAAYTTPVKSLSNDKVRELRSMFGAEKVGIATGDIKENLDAPIVVATLESYRNSLLGIEPDLGRSLVVFDEYHYLQDEGRGSAWEEALILTPPSCQVLLLSASVANAEEFADWISNQGKKRCTLVRTEHRPVPLTNLVYYGGHWLTEDNLPKDAFKYMNPTRQQLPLRHEDLVTRLPALIELELTPCIIYCGKRFDCENLAMSIERVLPPLTPEQAERIGTSLQQSHQDIKALSFIKPSLRRMIQTYGVAFHHSGLAPSARIAIERLVKDGLLRFCVATMGLSLGINFSVRSALIADYQRPGEAGMTPYAEGEILQMLGRAGRRGKDVIGFSLWPSVESYSRQAGSKREPCNSRLRTDPTTLLGLLGRGLNLSTVEGIYNKSFLKYQHRKTDLRLIRKPDVENKLSATSLPCISPAAEFGRFRQTDNQPVSSQNLCGQCHFKSACHNYLEFRAQGNLARMHLHLHQFAFIEKDESLTPLGSIARYFPQSGGLVISSMIDRRFITQDKILAACELMATLCLPRFKEPGCDANYRLPFDAVKVEEDLELFYPIELFPEVYDLPFGRRTWHQIKDFNPSAGWVVRQWLMGKEWPELVRMATTEYFGVGDLMGLLYRVATYLQSIAALPDFRSSAIALRRELLRSPLDLTL